MTTFVLGEWCHWNNHVGEYIYPTDDVPDYTSILVPNVDNTRTSFLLETIAKQRKVIPAAIKRPFFPDKSVFYISLGVIQQYFIHLGCSAHWGARHS